MKHTLKNIFHSPRFVVGFTIFMIMLLTVLIYPYIITRDPLAGLGKQFLAPGTYVSVYDINNTGTYRVELPDAALKRMESSVPMEDRETILAFLTAKGVDVSGLDTSNDKVDDLLALWKENYDEADVKANKYEGFSTQAKRKALKRMDTRLNGDQSAAAMTVTSGEGEDAVSKTVADTDYVRVDEVANAITLPLGTDNFGRDTLTELVKATGVSLVIGLIAGTIATLLGLTVGLLAGYVGGIVDDILMFIANLFTVIPGFVLLILIYYSVGQEARGATTCAIVIGVTSWVWTARSVRSQVISLRNRDHVNLSKLSGHSLIRIVTTDILPYIASYVVMAFILQVSSGILAEAQLSLLGLGPKTTDVPTLGLMMNWAKLFGAYTSSNAWWAYFPVILVIALTSFSLNLMNTGLDQVFNPTLRD
ncbi:MAG: ABC transporter permease [Clostridiales bacterium]|nr:ABC transporter permease [Clostridiales bacterium]